MLPVIREDQLHSMRVVRELLPWRDKLLCAFGTSHGNAEVELIDVLIVFLAAFFNPMVRSQRFMEALSSQDWIKQQTHLERIPKSTLSDALRRFDPEQLRPLITALAARVPALGRRDAGLLGITRQIVAADGSYFTMVGQAAWALMTAGSARPDGAKRDQVRLNMQIDVDSFCPVDCDISGADDAGEAKAFMRRLKPGVIYVVDRNFVNFAFINAVLERDSNLVLRLKKSNHFDVESSRPLSEEDRAAGVLADELGTMPGARSSGNADHRSFSAAPPQQTLRRVTIWDEKNKTQLILITDLLDVPAHVIGTIYRQRWQIELFFKWLKCWAGFDHLISHDHRGVTLQFYVAVIGTLLLHIATGRRVNRYALFWLDSIACGRATWEQMQEHLARIERQKELERARLRRKAAEKKAAQAAEKTSH